MNLLWLLVFPNKHRKESLILSFVSRTSDLHTVLLDTVTPPKTPSKTHSLSCNKHWNPVNCYKHFTTKLQTPNETEKYHVHGIICRNSGNWLPNAVFTGQVILFNRSNYGKKKRYTRCNNYKYYHSSQNKNIIYYLYFSTVENLWAPCCWFKAILKGIKKPHSTVITKQGKESGS